MRDDDQNDVLDFNLLKEALAELREQLQRERNRADQAEKQARELAEQTTDLKLREAMSRTRAEAAAAEADRLRQLLGTSFWSRLWRRKRPVEAGGSGRGFIARPDRPTTDRERHHHEQASPA